MSIPAAGQPLLPSRLLRDSTVQAWWPAVREHLAVLEAAPDAIGALLRQLVNAGEREGWSLTEFGNRRSSAELWARIEAGQAVNAQFRQAEEARSAILQLIEPHVLQARLISPEQFHALPAITQAALLVQHQCDQGWPRLVWTVRQARRVAAGQLSTPLILPGWWPSHTQIVAAQGQPWTWTARGLEQELRRRGEHWDQ